MKQKYEKMSKSKNNSVSVDEVINMVAEINEEYVFIDQYDNIIQIKQNIYRDPNDGFYYTIKKYGKRPLFLVKKSNINILPDLVFKNTIVNQFEHYNRII